MSSLPLNSKSQSSSQADFAAHSFKQVAGNFSGVMPVYRVVVGFIIAALLWNSRHLPHFFEVNATFRIQDNFFPWFATNATLLIAFYVIPIAFGIEAMFTRNVKMLRVQSICTAICLFGLMTHQGTYNNVTYLTSFWASLWCVWFTMRINDPEEILLSKAKTFSILIISMIFLGGAAGKWTPGYWSGEVLYQIYFVERDFWFHNLLRASLDAEELRNFATIYSRMVVLVETACIFLWLLPTRIAATLGICVWLGICIFSNFDLFSVMFSMIGLTIVALHEPKKE